MAMDYHQKNGETSNVSVSYNNVSDSAFDCEPRTSFSGDFVRGKEAQFKEVCINEHKLESPDFEFAKPDSIGLPASVRMLPADELFQNGKLLPLQLISRDSHSNCYVTDDFHHVTLSSGTDTSEEICHDSSLLQSLSLSQYSPTINNYSPPMSPKGLKCSAKLGELFRSRKGRFHIVQFSSNKEKPPWSFNRLFGKSKMFGAEEMDKFILRCDSSPLSSTSMQNESAMGIFSGFKSTKSSRLAFFDEKENDRCSKDLQVNSSIAPRRLLRCFSQDNEGLTSTSKSSSSLDARRSFTKSSLEKLPPENALARRTTGRRSVDKSGISLSEYCTRSPSYSGKMHERERTKIHGQIDYLRLPDKTSSNVRVTPVLNLPVYRGPSLRGVNIAKGRLENFRHLLFRSKDPSKELPTAEQFRETKH